MSDYITRSIDLDNPQHARLVWTCLVEPGDELAGQLIAAVGPVSALEIVRWTAVENTAQDVMHPKAVALTPDLRTRQKAKRRIDRWATRLDALDLSAILRSAASLKVQFITPDHEDWPYGLNDLADGTPIALWIRSAVDRPLRKVRLPIALVGSRASTGYGTMVASEISAELVERGHTVVSGGAFGIDISAHQGALAATSQDLTLPTMAILAGGIDRLYPAGNEDVLRQIIGEGAIVSESPPGFAPTRSRFLQRNRLIAGISNATIVIEAAHRSGALNTASWAGALNRPLGAVPGPVTSPNSAGCHRLLRELAATCITDASEASELAQPILSGHDAESSEQPGNEGEATVQGQVCETARMEPAAQAVFDALSSRGVRDLQAVAIGAGLTLGESRSTLGFLVLQGHVESLPNGWRKVKSPPGS